MANDRIGTVRNLEQDGTYDIMILDFKDSFPVGQLGFKIGNTPRKITGVQKVAQVFLYILLTSKGSDPINPNLGTGLNEYIIRSNITYDRNTLYSDITSFIEDATRQARFLTTDVNKQDKNSQLDTVKLISVEPIEDSISIGLHIITKGGKSASISIPFPELDLKVSR